jgi:hypothetical protein
LPRARFTREVFVAAPPAVVWEVLADFASYKEWNPVITLADGRLEEGRRMALRIAPSGRIAYIVRPRLSRVVPERELRWRRRLPFRTTEQLFELEAVPGGTQVTHGTEAWGPLVPGEGSGRRERMREAVMRDYAPFEAALRERAEASTRP